MDIAKSSVLHPKRVFVFFDFGRSVGYFYCNIMNVAKCDVNFWGSFTSTLRALRAQIEVLHTDISFHRNLFEIILNLFQDVYRILQALFYDITRDSIANNFVIDVFCRV